MSALLGLSQAARRIQEVTGSVPRTWPVPTGGYEASVQYGDYWRYAVGRTEEEALERLVELVEGGSINPPLSLSQEGGRQ